MKIRESLAKGLLIALAFALIPVTAVSAQKITPGSTCKVLNQKVVYQNKSYTCTKSGKKLVWNKGVTVEKPTPTRTVTPNKTPTATPTPAPVTLSALPTNYGDTKQPEFVSGVQTPQEIVLSQNSGQIKLTVVLQDDLNSIQPFFFGLRRVDLGNSFVGNVIFRTSVSKLISQVSDNRGITETFELYLDLPKGLAPGTYWLEGGIRDYANNWSGSENNPGKVSFFPLLVVK
jgi:hypothetical protein